MTLLIAEQDIREMLSIKSAIPVIEEMFRMAGEGTAEDMPRVRMPFAKGFLQFGAGALHDVTTPAADDRLGVQFPDFFDQVGAVEVAGGFAGDQVVLHRKGKVMRISGSRIEDPGSRIGDRRSGINHHVSMATGDHHHRMESWVWPWARCCGKALVWRDCCPHVDACQAFRRSASEEAGSAPMAPWGIYR